MRHQPQHKRAITFNSVFYLPHLHQHSALTRSPLPVYPSLHITSHEPTLPSKKVPCNTPSILQQEANQYITVHDESTSLERCIPNLDISNKPSSSSQLPAYLIVQPAIPASPKYRTYQSSALQNQRSELTCEPIEGFIAGGRADNS